jgi:hypothetical protein
LDVVAVADGDLIRISELSRRHDGDWLPSVLVCGRRVVVGAVLEQLLALELAQDRGRRDRVVEERRIGREF